MDFVRERLDFAVELNRATRELGSELRSRATTVRLKAQSLVVEAKLLRGSSGDLDPAAVAAVPPPSTD